jgi:hypothetical protein
MKKIQIPQMDAKIIPIKMILIPEFVSGIKLPKN